MKAVVITILTAALFCLFGCQGKEQTVNKSSSEKKKEPNYITVQHILIGFTGSIPGKPISRTKAEAQARAEEILAKATAGEDFDTLVKEYTDDSHPGIYKLANHGMPADPQEKVYPRGGMVAAFGDVGFTLDAGEIGMAPYDLEKSPYGWHIIKRID